MLIPWYFTDLPQIKLYGKSHHNKNEKPRFYDDLMPNCEGLPNGWKFKIDGEFSLDASNKDEYYLHLNQNQVHISWLYNLFSGELRTVKTIFFSKNAYIHKYYISK